MVLDKKQNKDITNIHAVEIFRPVRIKNIIHLEWHIIFKEEDYKEKLKKYGFR